MPSFLIERAKEQNYYGRVKDVLAESLPDEWLLPPPIRAEDNSAIIIAAIDGATFYNFLESFLKKYRDWLYGRDQTLYFRYNLEAVKEKLKSAANERLAVRYSNLPVCDLTQIRNREPEKLSCRYPGEIDQQETHALINQYLSPTIAQIPTELVITDQPSWRSGRDIFIKSIQLARLLIFATIILTAIFLLWYRQRGLRTLGVILLIAGLIQIGVSLIAWDAVVSISEKIITDTIKPAAMASILSATTVTILEGIRTSIGTSSLITVSVGLILIVISLFIRPKKLIQLKSL